MDKRRYLRKEGKKGRKAPGTTSHCFFLHEIQELSEKDPSGSDREGTETDKQRKIQAAQQKSE